MFVPWYSVVSVEKQLRTTSHIVRDIMRFGELMCSVPRSFMDSSGIFEAAVGIA